LDAAETGHLVLATMHSATSGEALNRLCMSFPADIQSSIRAQLADCLVGVVSQRLQYLEKWQLRVPLCEILIPNSGARGTIRAGQFSQIGNVIQSGGDEGMWTFDRYQRWMDQQKDWVRPTPPAIAGDGEVVRAATRVATPAAAAARPAAPAALAKAAGKVAPAKSAVTPLDGPEEITIDEPMDLEELAELARKIERRTP
jgi:twitching motility protein PilT